MTRLPASGTRIDTPSRPKGQLRAVLCNLGAGQAFDEATQDELYWKLGAIIGRWSQGRDRLAVSPVDGALRALAKNLAEASRLLRGLETGLRNDLEIAVASQVANVLSMNPTVGSRSGQEMLRSFCEEADHIAHVCLVAATDLPQTPGKRGWPALFWHDEFTALLLDIACKAGIAPTHGKDRITRKRTGWLVEAAKALETFLPRDMRSPDVETCGKRLERSLQNLGKIERQKFSPN